MAEKQNAHNDLIYSVAVSPDGSKIVSGSNDGFLKLWAAGVPTVPAAISQAVSQAALENSTRCSVHVECGVTFFLDCSIVGYERT